MFSIITPTYRRKEKLLRAVDSLLAQEITDWEIIIINDSPDDASYNDITNILTDHRIHYYVNERNEGVNYSRNKALEKISPDSTWVIFLDDDDYFAHNTLKTLQELSTTHKEKKWFVTNRAYSDGAPITSFPKDDSTYSYAWDYLISKKCKGDATHMIHTSLIKNTFFSKKNKQGEEWFFFYQIGLHEKMYYHNYTSTLTDGYEKGGLNFRERTFKEQWHTLCALTQEGIEKKLVSHLTFLCYLCMRMVRMFIK